MGCLLVIVSDYLSAIIAKGEFTPCYYNPGNLFDEVHIMMTNDDRPNPSDLQQTVGDARIFLHNVAAPPSSALQTLGFRKGYFRKWAAEAVEIAGEISPHLVRCYGHSPITFAAYAIKRQLGTPYVVSLHGNPDVDYMRGRLAPSWKHKICAYLNEPIERIGILNADFVAPVYSPVVPYLKRIKAQRYEIVYNAVGHGCVPRENYTLNKSCVRLLSVGRQVSGEKDPLPILQAVAVLPHVHLTIIGEGDLHDRLQEYANGAAKNVRFIRAMANRQVLEEMKAADIYVYSSMNFEISKSVMEAALCGLPILLNYRHGETATELTGGQFLLVENCKEGFVEGLKRLIEDDILRETLGRSAADLAHRTWKPQAMETKMVSIYNSLMRKG
jgi:glycosyltransferase involved in cell wall biosynthesis